LVVLRALPWLAFWVQGEFELQFEVNGQEYFLSFVEDPGRWVVTKPTARGLEVIPVYVDAPKYERFGILEKDRHNVLN